MATVKNTTDGPRAVLTQAGEVGLAPGASANVQFAPGGITAARMIGLEVDGEEEATTGADVLAELLARAETAEAGAASADTKHDEMVKTVVALTARAETAEAGLIEATSTIQNLTGQLAASRSEYERDNLPELAKPIEARRKG